MYTISGAARVLDMHRTTVHRLVTDGRVPAYRSGRHWIITDEGIEALRAFRDAGHTDSITLAIRRLLAQNP